MKGGQLGPGQGTPYFTLDGVFRFIDYTTSPPTVMDARPLTPKEIDEFFKGIGVPKPEQYNGVDGTKVPPEEWFVLPKEVLEQDQK